MIRPADLSVTNDSIVTNLRGANLSVADDDTPTNLSYAKLRGANLAPPIRATSLT